MAQPLTYFRWTYPEGGFRVVPAFDPEDQSEVEMLIPRDPQARRWLYNPLAEAPRLFEELAHLRETPEAFAAFAGRRGLLGLEGMEGGAACLARRDGRWWITAGPPDTRGESVRHWSWAVKKVREAFELWAALTSGKPQEAEQVRVSPDGVSFKGSGHYFRLEGEPFSSVLRRGGPSAGVALVLQDLVNPGLEEHTQFQLVFDEKDRRLHLHAGPNSLLGVAWFQIAEAVDGRHRPRRCARCGRWFVVSGKRGDDEYCDATCRVAAHRRRRKARELADEGMRPSMIAKELGTDTKSVRGWLEEPSRNGRNTR